MNFHVRVLEVTDDGTRQIEVRRPLGTVETREFSREGLNEYIEASKRYCEDKGYNFVIEEVNANEK
jgi:hypothetical protein